MSSSTAHLAKAPHQRSHGESFIDLIVHRFGSNGLLLDEPEAAFSVHGQLQLLVRIHDLIDQDCQFIVATLTAAGERSRRKSPVG